jgi:presenilin-like A22 family membrane protease
MFNIKISQKTKIYVLLLIVAALSVSYIMNKQISAFISLVLLSGLAYALSKNIVMSLAISIIFTNLLLSMNYFVVEGLQAQSLTIGTNSYTGDTIEKLNALQAKDNSIII